MRIFDTCLLSVGLGNKVYDTSERIRYNMIRYVARHYGRGSGGAAGNQVGDGIARELLLWIQKGGMGGLMDPPITWTPSPITIAVPHVQILLYRFCCTDSNSDDSKPTLHA